MLSIYLRSIGLCRAGAFVCVALLPACGGGGSSGSAPPPATRYTVGGMVTGLNTGPLVLLDNGADALTVSSSGAFTFKTSLSSALGSAPDNWHATKWSELHDLSMGTGTIATANVTNVSIACTATATYTIGGKVSGLGSGLSVALLDNGGDAFTATASRSIRFQDSAGQRCELRRHDWLPATGRDLHHKYRSGSISSANVTSIAIACAATTSSSSPDLGKWSNGRMLYLSTEPWGSLDGRTCRAHASIRPLGRMPPAICGYSAETPSQRASTTLGNMIPCRHVDLGRRREHGRAHWNLRDQGHSIHNVPGGRAFGASWIDAAGNLWLFGGQGEDSTGTFGYLNDQQAAPRPTARPVSGSTVVNSGVYGTNGTPAVGNVPGARDFSVSWIDASGNLWLFGGIGHDSTGNRATGLQRFEFSPVPRLRRGSAVRSWWTPRSLRNKVRKSATPRRTQQRHLVDRRRRQPLALWRVWTEQRNGRVL